MTTIATHIYQSLAEQIIKGALPPGQKLEEKVLAEQFGVSRTPIREALRELAARGLVDFTPRRGGVVARIGIDRLTDMLEAQCALEALCARLASERMTAIEKGQLQELHEQAKAVASRGDREGYLDLNQQFHALICAGSHNATLSAMVRELRDRLSPFRRTQSAGIDERLMRSLEEHASVVEAILGSDPEAAFGAMRGHNARLSTGVLGLIRKSPAPVPAAAWTASSPVVRA
jgi:DNA-binding GntR family transcriptional regulator